MHTQPKHTFCWSHDDVIKWKHFPRNWPFVRGIHRSPVNSPHKGQWRGALMFPLICVWINGWENNREAGDLRHCRTHYDVTVMWKEGLIHTETEMSSFWHFFPLATYKGLIFTTSMQILRKTSIKMLTFHFWMLFPNFPNSIIIE